MIQDTLTIRCDLPGCETNKTSFETGKEFVQQLNRHGWLYLTIGQDLCPTHNLCNICGEPWSAGIHEGPADTLNLHLHEPTL